MPNATVAPGNLAIIIIVNSRWLLCTGNFKATRSIILVVFVLNNRETWLAVVTILVVVSNYVILLTTCIYIIMVQIVVEAEKRAQVHIHYYQIVLLIAQNIQCMQYLLL